MVRSEPNTFPLDQLPVGETAVILSVGSQRSAVKHRLVDMGLTPGVPVTLHKIAPFGDPLELTLRGYELSLRKEDAQHIRVCKLSDAPAPAEAPARQTMSQRLPSEETLRRMALAHKHEHTHHHAPVDEEAHEVREMKLALVGNPNCGKTTLFNALTGSNQYVGNWPGVTVEKKEGLATIDDRSVTIVDLPGIYSLSPYSMEEIVARNFIVEESPDAIINIVDATNLERNLYLTVQLLELEKPMVVALNFMDEVARHGDKLDLKRLSQALGVPVVPITARSGENIDELLRLSHEAIHSGFTLEPDDLYDDFTHQIHHRVGELVHDRAYSAHLPAHWASIKLLEGDELVEKSLNLSDETRWKLGRVVEEYEAAYPLGDRETLVADSRYQFISRVVRVAVKKGRALGEPTTSDKIDSIVTHRVLAVPIFLLTMLFMFALTFGPLGTFLSDGVEYLIGSLLSPWLQGQMAAWGLQPWLISLVVDGIIGGVGGVLTFLPQIALLFLFLSFLEDSGYMARAAFIMDRLLRRFGLSGKAFIPMLMGFGCTVPAIMGARTMEQDKDRRMTMLLVPFMSCSARLPVYGLLSAAFFPQYAGLVVFSLYLVGLLCAILSGILFKKLIFKGEPAAFLLELPPYRLPTVKNCLRHVWEKVRGFLVKAGTLILTMSMVLWFLQSFVPGLQMVENAGDSFLGRFGSLIAPVLSPLGFGTWQAAVALLSGLIAKEAVVSTLSLLYGFSLGAGGATVAAALSGTFQTPLAAYSFLLFVLLYVPCVAAVSTMYREMNSLKWTLFSVLWQIFAAFLVSFLVFQIGSLLL